MKYAYDNRKIFFLGFVCLCVVLFFYEFSDILFPFIFGFVLSYLLAPATQFLSRYINRSIVSFLFVVLFFAIVISAGFVFIPKIKEYISYIVEHLPQYHEDFSKLVKQFLSWDVISQYQVEIDSLKEEIQKYSNQKFLILTSVLKEIVSKKNTIAEWVSFFIITPISFYYFNRDWENLSSKIYNIIPLRQHVLITEIFFIIRKSFRKFFHAQFCVVAILSAYYYVFLKLIDTNHCLLLGLLSGLLSFIPFIGAIISCFIVIFLSVSYLTIPKLCILMIVYAVGQFIEGYILSPNFVGKRTGLHPLWILFAFFAGFKVLGILGVIISIPVIAMMRDLINFGIQKLKASQMYKR